MLLEKPPLSGNDVTNHIFCHVVAKVTHMSDHRKGHGLDEIHGCSKVINMKMVSTILHLV